MVKTNVGMLLKSKAYEDTGFGSSRYGLDKPFMPIQMEVSLPVQRAVLLTRDLWKERGLPIGFKDNCTYRGDLGFIIKDGISEVLEVADREFQRSELITRISFADGITFPNKPDEKSDRLEISIYGARKFFPNDFKNVLRGRVDDKRLSVTSVLEEFLIALNWQDGQFVDWNDVNVWAQNLDAKTISPRRFHLGKSTYAFANEKRISQKNSSEDENPEEIKKIIRKVKRQDVRIPLSPSLTPYGQGGRQYPANDLLKELFNAGVMAPNGMPIIGVQAVIGSLGLKGNELDSRIAKMSPMEGVEFLFGKVLPEVQKYLSL